MLRKLLIYIFTGLILSLIINLLYERYLRPDNLFFSRCLQQSGKWEKYIRAQGQPCYVFAGGSEVRMNIEPTTMWEQHRLPSINAGIQAGNTARANAQIALSLLRNGDTLVMSYLSNRVPEHASHGGINFCFRHLGINTFRDNILKPDWRHLSMLLYGNSANYGIHLMRILTRPECIYRYSSAENARISESGRVEVLLHSEQNNKIERVRASDIKELPMTDWKRFVEDLQAACEKRKAHLIAYITRQHCSTQHRRNNILAALYLTRLGVPVLKDPMLGCWETCSVFSDSAQHMSIEAGREFSAYLAELIKTNNYWSEAELLQLLTNTPSADE